MNGPLDKLLSSDWLQPPADFTQTVMQRIAQMPRAAVAPPARWHRVRRAAAVAGVIGSGILGLSQLAGFVFGLWLAGAAL